MYKYIIVYKEDTIVARHNDLESAKDFLKDVISKNDKDYHDYDVFEIKTRLSFDFEVSFGKEIEEEARKEDLPF
jgi:hypothetical protein